MDPRKLSQRHISRSGRLGFSWSVAGDVLESSGVIPRQPGTWDCRFGCWIISNPKMLFRAAGTEMPLGGGQGHEQHDLWSDDRAIPPARERKERRWLISAIAGGIPRDLSDPACIMRAWGTQTAAFHSPWETKQLHQQYANRHACMEERSRTPGKRKSRLPMWLSPGARY